MAQKLTVNFKDVNGEGSRTQFWCNDTPTAVQAAQALSNLSNAQIVSAYLTRDLDISEIPNNTAVAANVETVYSKAKVRFSGPDEGSVSAPRLEATLSIPAPVGTIINGETGLTSQVLLQPFVGLIATYNGLATDRIDKVYYSRSR